MKTLIIAHRGASTDAPENTMSAFEKALEQGCDGIELDVQLSADNKLIVCHDRTVNRTTNGKGMIRQMTARDIQQLDAGSWFHESFHAERMPVLEDVLRLVPENILVNIEVKHAADNDHVEYILANVLHRMQRTKNVLVSSFHHRFLYLFKHIAPTVRIGLLYSANPWSAFRYRRSLLRAKSYSVHPFYKRMNVRDIERCRQYGVHVFPYTVDQIKDARPLLEAGVSGIITNVPQQMRNVRDQLCIHTTK